MGNYPYDPYRVLRDQQNAALNQIAQQQLAMMGGLQQGFHSPPVPSMQSGESVSSHDKKKLLLL